MITCPRDKSKLLDIAEEAAKIVESLANPIELLRGETNGGFEIDVVHVRI